MRDRLEIAWKEHGPAELARLYAEEAMLVGYVTAIGRAEIADLLRGIVAQGWTGIKITTRHARRFGDVILVASDYTATKSDAQAGETMDAKSSHVLVKIADEWLSAMHTAA